MQEHGSHHHGGHHHGGHHQHGGDHEDGAGRTDEGHRGLRRRDVLAAGAAGVAGGLLLRPAGALAAPLGPRGVAGAERVSRLGRRARLAHADLHNHSLQSDGSGDPALAFESMRDAGLDVAALTDHSTVSKPLGPIDACAAFPPPQPGSEDPCRSLAGMNQQAWENTRRYADAADDPGEFTALRGFEWSSPLLGHVNVWFTQDWTDPLSTAGFSLSSLLQLGLTESGIAAALGPLGPLGQQLLDLIRRSEPRGMALFYEWLRRSPQTPLVGGGADGLAGFNHPNREPGVFDAFAYEPALSDRIVSMEIMNRRDDYLFEGWAAGFPSPLVACLDAGWRVGLLGVTDEHGTDWGEPDGKGRAGLWVDQLDRGGVRRALAARDFFATNVRGLRLDATAQGSFMGRSVPHRARDVRFEVDLDRGPEHAGEEVEIQVLTSGDRAPTVVHVESVRVPDPRERRPIRFRAPIDRDSASWAVLRIADPTKPNLSPGPEGHPCNNLALAYSSPFWFEGASRRPRGGGRPPVTARGEAADLRDLLTRGH
ncbi:DUF3604 domain-containing protein [Blastococcus sp. SYSU DS0616]